jgi:hypothetical protein
VGPKKLVEAPDYRNRIGDLVLLPQARTRLKAAEIPYSQRKRDLMSQAGSPKRKKGVVESQAAIRWNDTRCP